MSPRRKARQGSGRNAGTAESSPGRTFRAEEAEAQDVEWKLGVGVGEPSWMGQLGGKLRAVWKAVWEGH